jgi:hypothetical protein
MCRRWFLAALVPVAVVVALADGRAQAPAETSDVRKAAEQLVDSLEPESLQGEAWVKAKRIARPLLIYTDPTRGDDSGFLWAWSNKGRPLAVAEMFQKTTNKFVWDIHICNTSGVRLRAGRMGAPWWLENDSDIAFKDVPAAPPLGAEPALRQRQMKLLAQNFTAYTMFRDGVRTDLRRLDRPLHSYRDEEAGILEGGLFAFANGTNPEMLLFIEARQGKGKSSKPVWQFGVSRATYGQLHAEYEGKEVYFATYGNLVIGRDKPFWSSSFRFTPPVAPPGGKSHLPIRGQ